MTSRFYQIFRFDVNDYRIYDVEVDGYEVVRKELMARDLTQAQALEWVELMPITAEVEY